LTVRIIEIVVSPKGESTVQTKGYAGTDCLEAGKWLEQALGIKTIDRKPRRQAHQRTAPSLPTANPMAPAGSPRPGRSKRSMPSPSSKGDVVATDGRQLLIQAGFQFPWKGALLVPRTPVFTARELPQGEAVHVAKSEKDVLIRIGSWTIALHIDSMARFPNVDSAIPSFDHVITRWSIPDEEVPALVKILDDLPAAKESTAPVTLDLAKRVAIRARAEGEKTCTEVAVPSSSVQGKAVRIATNRRFVQQALKLGFRTFQVIAPDKPILCQDDKRLYVWVPLHPESVLAPQSQAARTPLPALAKKNESRIPAAHRSKLPESSAAPTPAPANAQRMFDGFLNCAHDLWTLVRKHHREESRK
jgi:hypothetical protein